MLDGVQLFTSVLNFLHNNKLYVHFFVWVKKLQILPESGGLILKPYLGKTMV